MKAWQGNNAKRVEGVKHLKDRKPPQIKRDILFCFQVATTRSSWRRGGCAWSPSTRTSTSRPRWGRGTATTSTQRSPGPGSTRSWLKQSRRDKTCVNYFFLLWNWAAKWVVLGLTVVANFDLIGWLGPFWETPQTTARANALKRSASARRPIQKATRNGECKAIEY